MNKGLLRAWRFLVIFLVDTILIGVSGVLAFLVRFDFAEVAIPQNYLTAWLGCYLVQIVDRKSVV